MKAFTWSGLVVLVIVIATSECKPRAKRELRTKRDTGVNPNPFPSVPDNTLKDLLREGLYKLKEMKITHDHAAAVNIVVDHVVSALIKMSFLHESARTEAGTQLKAALTETKVLEDMEKHLLHLETQELHNNVAKQHGHGQPHYFQNQPQQAKHQTNRQHGQHGIPTKVHQGNQPSGNPQKHTSANQLTTTAAPEKRGPKPIEIMPGVTVMPTTQSHEVRFMGDLTPESMMSHFKTVITAVADSQSEDARMILVDINHFLEAEDMRVGDVHSFSHELSPLHAQNHTMTVSSAKKHLEDMVWRISSTGNKQWEVTALTMMLHILQSYDVSLTDYHPEQKHFGIEHVTPEYIMGYGLEIMDKLEAKHDHKDLKEIFQKLSKSLHMIKPTNQDIIHQEPTMENLRKFTKNIFKEMRLIENTPACLEALNFFSRFVQSFQSKFLDQVDQHKHQEIDDSNFGNKVAELEYFVFKVFDAMEKKLEGETLENAIREVFMSIGMMKSHGQEHQLSEHGDHRFEPSHQVEHTSHEQVVVPHHQGQADHHQGNATHHRERAEHHQGQADHHRGQADHHQRNATQHRERAEHHQGQADHHRGQADHYRGQADHHRERADHHQGQADHHRGQADHYRGQADHHRGQADHHQGKAFYHQGNATHHQERADHHQGQATNHRGQADHHQQQADYHHGQVAHHKEQANNHPGQAHHHQEQADYHLGQAAHHQEKANHHREQEDYHKGQAAPHQEKAHHHREQEAYHKAQAAPHQEKAHHHREQEAYHKAQAAPHQEKAHHHREQEAYHKAQAAPHQEKANHHREQEAYHKAQAAPHQEKAHHHREQEAYHKAQAAHHQEKANHGGSKMAHGETSHDQGDHVSHNEGSLPHHPMDKNLNVHDYSLKTLHNLEMVVQKYVELDDNDKLTYLMNASRHFLLSLHKKYPDFHPLHEVTRVTPESTKVLVGNVIDDVAKTFSGAELEAVLMHIVYQVERLRNDPQHAPFHAGNPLAKEHHLNQQQQHGHHQSNGHHQGSGHHQGNDQTHGGNGHNQESGHPHGNEHHGSGHQQGHQNHQGDGHNQGSGHPHDNGHQQGHQPHQGDGQNQGSGHPHGNENHGNVHQQGSQNHQGSGHNHESGHPHGIEQHHTGHQQGNQNHQGNGHNQGNGHHQSNQNHQSAQKHHTTTSATQQEGKPKNDVEGSVLGLGDLSGLSQFLSAPSSKPINHAAVPSRGAVAGLGTFGASDKSTPGAFGSLGRIMKKK